MTFRDYETSSALGRIGECPASATLPRTDEANEPADIGNAKHEHLQDRAALGVDEAMARIPDVAKKWRLSERESFFFGSWAKKFEWSPPRHSFGEVSLALLADGTVERTTGGKGHYPELEEGGRLHGRAILAGQTDVIWSHPEPLDVSDPTHPRCPKGSVLWIGDYKGGTDAHVDPIDVNLQVAGNTVMMARWTGAELAVPFVCFLNPPKGDWDAPEVAWGTKELADAHARVETVLRRRAALIALARAGQPVDGFREGHWCTFCPGKLSCPAKVAMMRLVADLATTGGALTTDDDAAAIWWALRVSQIESLTKKAREQLKRRVDAKGPITLPDGRVWGRVEVPRSKIIPHVALPIIEDELSKIPRPEEETDAEQPFFAADNVARISREAIEDVVRTLHAKAGVKRQLSSTMGRIMGRIKSAGGLESTPSEQYTAYRPSAALVAPTEGDEEEAAQ